jgi:hypothetical protein
LTCGFAGVFEGRGEKKSPGLKPLDSARIIQGAEAPCSLRKAKTGVIPQLVKHPASSEEGKGGSFVWEKGQRVECVRAVSGSFDSLRSLRMTAKTNNGEGQATAKAKCGDSSLRSE